MRTILRYFVVRQFNHMPSNLLTVKDIAPENWKGKKVLLRVDFNVAFKDGEVAEDFRIKHSMPTINYLREAGAKVILMSHIGGENATLKPVAEYLSAKLTHSNTHPGLQFTGDAYCHVQFSSVVFGKETEDKINQMQNGDVLLLENLRSEKGEEENDEEFSKKLAALGDFFVNDAFSASHRKHASIVGLPKLLPSCVGLQFEKEVRELQLAFSPEHPFLVILGGVKFESKLAVLEKFLKIADNVFIGGALANNFFKAKGEDVGSSITDESVNIAEFLNNPKILLPVDSHKHGESIWDCGPKTVEKLKEVVEQVKFILWSGPIGNFEQEGFDAGTKALAEMISQSKAKSIVGGGDTITAIDKFGLLDKFDFVSTGGGAMLEFLAQGTLPGIEALNLKT